MLRPKKPLSMETIEEEYLCHQYRFAERRRRFGCGRTIFIPILIPDSGFQKTLAQLTFLPQNDANPPPEMFNTPLARRRSGCDLGR